MTYRRTLRHRKWLTGAAYDKYTVSSMVHFDLYCYRTKAEVYYFEVYTSVSGKAPLAFSRLAVCSLTDALVLCNGVNPLQDVKLTYWTRARASLFAKHHGALLAGCVIPDGFRSRSIHCHYVKPYDADPWPRGTLNTWQAPRYAPGKKPGRPRKVRAVDLPNVL